MEFSGPSPHTWGLLPQSGGSFLSDRSIPTYVGFTVWARRGNCQNDGPSPHTWGLLPAGQVFHVVGRSIPTYVGFTIVCPAEESYMAVHPHIRGVYAGGNGRDGNGVGPSPHTWGLRTIAGPAPKTPAVHPHIRGVYPDRRCGGSLPGGPSPHTWGLRPRLAMASPRRLVHPHIRGVYARVHLQCLFDRGPSPHTWGLHLKWSSRGSNYRSIPTYVGFTNTISVPCAAVPVHPHIRGVYSKIRSSVAIHFGPSPHTWGLRLAASFGPRSCPVHPHIRGVYTEIKSKISRASSKTALLPAEKFKILFLVKIKSSAAAFQVHTIFQDQFPPGLHFEIALHL